jgi:hypothetical protein
MPARGRLRIAPLVALVLLFGRPALAAEIRDGDNYAITLPEDVRACFVFPAAMFDRAKCAPEARPATQSPIAEPNAALAIGSVRIDDHGTQVNATLTTTLTKETAASRPDDLHAFARGMAKAMAESRFGARLRGEPGASFVDIAGQSFGRVSFDLDGYYGDGAAHEVAYMAWAEGGTYAFSLTGNATHAPALDALADRAAATLRLAHPAPTKDYRRGEALGFLVGKIVGVLLIPLTALVVALFFLRSSRRRRPPGAGPTTMLV